MPRLRGEQALVAVPISPGSTVFQYGYKMNKAQHGSIGGDLGIELASAAAGVFFGCNSPKPPRATKRSAGGTQSSFFNFAKADTLRTAGWNLSGGGKKRGVKLSGASRTVYVETPRGYYYAWNMASSEVAKFSDIGVTEATASDANKLIWGSFPKPPKASKSINGVGNISSFCSPEPAAIELAVEAGWSVAGLDPDWLT